MSPPASSIVEDSDSSSTPSSVADDSTTQLYFTGMGWEEPHPGNKLSYSMDVSAGRCGENDGDGTDHTDGGCTRGAMAAKGDLSYHYTANGIHRPWQVRRDIRARARSHLPKPLTISGQEGCEGPETRSAPLMRVVDSTFNSNIVSPIHIGAPTIESVTSTLNMDIDSDTEVGIDCDQSTIAAETSSISSPGHLTDFSNHLGIHMRSEDSDDASITVVDSDAFSHMSPDSDLYGWDAELDRKSQLEYPACENTAYKNYEDLHYRRANSGKKSLLHRVLSIGTMPPRPTDSRRTTPTSFAMRGGGLI